MLRSQIDFISIVFVEQESKQLLVIETKDRLLDYYCQIRRFSDGRDSIYFALFMTNRIHSLCRSNLWSKMVDGLLAAENSSADQYFIIPNSIVNLRLNRVN